jgi:hypothetical protein
MATSESFLRFRRLSTAAALVLAIGSTTAVGQTIRMGTDTRLDAATARQGALGSQLAYVPVTVEVAGEEHTFSLTAPHQHLLTERTAFVSEPATYGRLSPYSSETSPTDLSAAWRYRHQLQGDPGTTVGYTARARFDTTVGDTSSWRAGSEYMMRLDLERDIARFTPRIELGYRYAAHVLPDVAARPRLFSAVGTTYRYSERSSLELFFDQRAPLEGGIPEREVSVAWTQHTSARTRVVFYAVKSVSDGWYDAGLKLSMRF